MLNEIQIAGRMTRDPELKRTASGVSVTSFTLAVDRDYKGQNGERETDFIDVVAWRQNAEYATMYGSKGSMTIASGRLQIRMWEDRDGGKRKAYEIMADKVYVFGGKKEAPAGGGQPSGANYGAPASYQSYGDQDFSDLDMPEDDLPF